MLIRGFPVTEMGPPLGRFRRVSAPFSFPIRTADAGLLLRLPLVVGFEFELALALAVAEARAIARASSSSSLSGPVFADAGPGLRLF